LNHYEAIYILDPRLEDEQLTAVKTDLHSKLEAVGGQEIVELKCERRGMTFPIRKQTEGFYLIYRYQGPADSVGKLRIELKHAEQILRMSYLRIPESAAKLPEPVVAPPIAPAASVEPPTLIEPVAAAPVEPSPDVPVEPPPAAPEPPPAETFPA
jgi:small subunit ribosomal protein S6